MVKRYAHTALSFLLSGLLLSACASSGDHRATLAEWEQIQKEQVERTAELEQLKEDNDRLRIYLEAVMSSKIDRKRDLEEQIALFMTSLLEKDSALGAMDSKLTDCDARLRVLRNEVSRAQQSRLQTVNTLKATYDALRSRMRDEIQGGKLKISRRVDRVSLRFVERILFASGSVTITEEGQRILTRVASILENVSDKQIHIEGHTDDIPISSRLQSKFPTNWELSTIRAVNVAKYLVDAGHVDPGRVTVAGHSQYKPVASNDTEEGRALNRRIEIALIPLKSEKEASGSVRKVSLNP